MDEVKKAKLGGKKKEKVVAGILPHSNKPVRAPLIAVPSHPVFPGMFIPIVIISDSDMKAIDYAMKGNGIIALFVLNDKFLEKNNNNAQQKLIIDYSKDIYSVGVTGKIIKKINLPDGGYNIFVSTFDRIKFVKVVLSDKFPIIEIDYLKQIPVRKDDIQSKAVYSSILLRTKEIFSHRKMPEVQLNMVNIEDKGKLCDIVASTISSSKNDHQIVLETLSVKDRLKKVLELIYEELNLIEIQNKIAKGIQERLEKQQKEFFLKEQLKAIKAELGVGDKKNSDLEKLKTKLKALELKGESLDVVEKELEKFSLLETSSAEYIVIRNYLELITELPWRGLKINFDKLDLQKSKKILDKTHYGMMEVKDRIIEYISVLKLRKTQKGAIILLVGPPGVGKTSVGAAIAKVLRTKFFRFSVGGMRDESEIKGHRRTYVGALPGKIIQGLRITKTNSPVFLIDEVDKISASNYGDPFSVLLEVLDPEQNVKFRDHYLDLPFDISNVFFILTANSVETIPRPLLNRMEVIEVSGYVDNEKIEIARKYLIPKVLSENGVDKDSLKFQSSALVQIAQEYARDNGVRNFEKYLNKIVRKVARKLIENTEIKSYQISNENLEEYVGVPVFRKESMLNAMCSGMVMGLAWTNYGGSTLMIETVKTESKVGGIKLTGRLGDVMKESANIAYTYVNSIKGDLNISKSFFEKNIIHLHIPEGATPKDGPSAGITIASAFISLALNKVVRPHLAMTGELSLTGNVMMIGGLREKIIAAKRSGVEHIIVPQANRVDLEEIPINIKSGINFYLVDNMREVIKLLF
ncbi:ATP dependent PIM1 peptidase. Serine peptidase. MEROPS family S16 [Borreliella japonica]|uniref:Lon protease n=1 Tax=Borreliella japonica TaxID=34095 RepID=A0A1G4PKS7_BORJA|nr:endopeptidase La [Borreliella japonica]WKC88870.1 endopeptidase La [Borreliella japonica]SCW32860.1 ATP dependent PIM1 peptidase. Serine peptidase. MEROPS family S16 [Borreliella japonica]